MGHAAGALDRAPGHGRKDRPRCRGAAVSASPLFGLARVPRGQPRRFAALRRNHPCRIARGSRRGAGAHQAVHAKGAVARAGRFATGAAAPCDRTVAAGRGTSAHRSHRGRKAWRSQGRRAQPAGGVAGGAGKPACHARARAPTRRAGGFSQPGRGAVAPGRAQHRERSRRRPASAGQGLRARSGRAQGSDPGLPRSS